MQTLLACDWGDDAQPALAEAWAAAVMGRAGDGVASGMRYAVPYTHASAARHDPGGAVRALLARCTGPALAALGSESGCRCVYWSVAVAEPGAPGEGQERRTGHPWTVVVPLTFHVGQGGTLFAGGTLAVPVGPRQAYAFCGDAWHRASANHAPHRRVALVGTLLPAPDPEHRDWVQFR